MLLIAAGDISCPKRYEKRGKCKGPEVFSAFKKHNAEVLALGDLLQMSEARKKNYQENFFKTWPIRKDRLRPVPGNHDYRITHKGRDKKGYQSFLSSVGLEEFVGPYSWKKDDWRFFALDSNCDWIDCALDSDQLTWLAKELDQSDEKCLALYMHHPLFFPKGKKSVDNKLGLKNIWDLAELFGVSFILNGHMHYYERSKKVTPEGKEDRKGIRQFTVGSGGVPLSQAGKHANQETVKREFGFLELRLGSGYYRWSFNGLDGQSLDYGKDLCRSKEDRKEKQAEYLTNLGNKKLLANILDDL